MGKGLAEDGVVFHAGFPNAAEDGKFGSLSLGKLVVRHPASTFFWRLENDVPELLWPKDSIVVVDRALELRTGSVAVVVFDDEFILARYQGEKLYRLNGVAIDGEVSVWGVATYCLQPLQGLSL